MTVLGHEVYPNYSNQNLESSIENRYQDQALIQVQEDLSAISFIALTQTSSIDLRSFSQCLITGFGLQEASRTKTGFLSGSIIPHHQDTIRLEDGVINVNGAYFVELLPGDSGGPLLCYNSKNQQWFDLGTASAHSWEHESIYAANANLSFSSWALTHKQTRVSSPAQSRADRLTRKPKYLRPYSVVKETTGEIFYNGDLDLIIVSDIEDYDDRLVKATISVMSASINFLCLDFFLCYGDQRRVIIDKADLIESRHTFPAPYDPFSQKKAFY